MLNYEIKNQIEERKMKSCATKKVILIIKILEREIKFAESIHLVGFSGGYGEGNHMQIKTSANYTILTIFTQIEL